MAPSPFAHLIKDLEGIGHYYSLPALNDKRVGRLPYSIRILLESAIRNCDNFRITEKDVAAILDWHNNSATDTEVNFKPARVLLQDFTGVPAIVDLAAMRDTMKRLGGDPNTINPMVPVDLVVDHSVQVDSWSSDESREINEQKEYDRNGERFAFIKWASQSFNNVFIVPPGSGIVHQVNLEYLARVVFECPVTGHSTPLIYPDTVVGTDSHTTMIDGLGVLGWGVGGIEAEAVMLGEAISMVLPKVVGVKLIGELSTTCTATDLVLTITKLLRQKGVVGKFVEYFGPGCANLSLADRATIANMSPEYGATCGFFPIDEMSLTYLRQTGRDPKKVSIIEKYLRSQELFRTYGPSQTDPDYSDVIELNLASVRSCVAGPKRPQDLVYTSELKGAFEASITNATGFQGYGKSQSDASVTKAFDFRGHQYIFHHGSVLIAAITSCTNTSNPSVMLGAGILARNATAKGLKVLPYIKTSLAPGSGVVQTYLDSSGLTTSLNQLGFNVVGFGCTTCIGNSGDLYPEVTEAVESGEVIVCSVLSGNRNFEGRVHPLTPANFIMSPVLVVAYALAGRVDINFEEEPIGYGTGGSPVYLRDIWPSHKEIQEIEAKCVTPDIFNKCYESIRHGNKRWHALPAAKTILYPWNAMSTYIHNPPFFDKMTTKLPEVKDIRDAYCLLHFGDSITTDHISPAGKIARDSPAAVFLKEQNVQPLDFNSYGARRGNDEIMARGTFANIRLVNKLATGVGPRTVHIPTGAEMAVYDCAKKYMAEGKDLIIFAGKEYGSGSSRDWAAKGPYLLGVKLIIAESYEKIHRSNLIGMGIIPLQFLESQNCQSLGLTAKETFSVDLQKGNLHTGEMVTVRVSNGKEFLTKCRIDTEVELAYIKNGGILHYVLRSLLD